MKLDKKKIASLSREEKLLLLEALEEKKRRKANSRASFKPHEGQLEVIRDEHSKRIVICANGWGKTCVGVNEALWAAEGYNPITNKYTPVPAKVIVVLDSPEKVTDVWLPEIKRWRELKEEQLHKRGKPYYTEISFDNGSVIRFKFHLQEAMSFESETNIDMCIFDEPPFRHIWVALLRGGRQKGRTSRYLMIATPISQDWIRTYHQEWEKGMYPDTMFFRGITEQNKANLAEGYIEEFARHLTESEKKTRLFGDFFNTDGMALAGLLDRSQHLVSEDSLPSDYKQAWPHVIAIDPHPHKPLYACLVAVSPTNQRYYVREFARKILPRDFARWLKANWLAEHQVVDIVCDSAGNADYTGGDGFKSAIEVFNEERVKVRGTSYDEKKDDEFLERLQEGLHVPVGGDPKLLFLIGKSDMVWKDMENVQWQRLKGTESYKPKLEISNTDALATLKYALAANLTFSNASRKPRSTLKAKHPMMGNSKKPGYLEAKVVYNRRGRRIDNDGDW